MPVLSLQFVIGKGQIGPFFVFLGAISDCNVGFPQWRALAETLLIHNFSMALMKNTAIE